MHSFKTLPQRHMFSSPLYPFSGGTVEARAVGAVTPKAKAMAKTARKVVKNASTLKRRRNLRMAIPRAGVRGLGDIGADIGTDQGVDIAAMAEELEGLGIIDVDTMEDGDLLAAINAVNPELIDDLDTMVDPGVDGLGKKKKAVDPKRMIFRLTPKGWIQKTARGWVKSKTPPPPGAQIVQASTAVAKKAIAKGKAVPSSPATTQAVATTVYQPTLSTNQPTLVSSAPAYTPSPATSDVPAYSDAPYTPPTASGGSGFDSSLVPTFTPQPDPQASYDGSQTDYGIPQGERVIETSEGFIDESGEYVDESLVEEGPYMGALGFKFGSFLKKALPIAAGFIPFVGPVAQQVITGLSQGLDVKDPKTGKPLLPPETGTIQTLPDGRQGLISPTNQILATRKDAKSPWIPYSAPVAKQPAPKSGSSGAASSAASILPYVGMGIAALAFLA